MEIESPAPVKIYFRNLDSIRFFAALMVFLSHSMLNSYTYLNIRGTILERFLGAISDGSTGVSIFFVLSGFLITYLILSEINLKGNFSLKNFYVRRILRIWPLYFAVIIIAFVLFPALAVLLNKPLSPGASIWYQLTFLSNFDIMHIEQFRHSTEIFMQNITWSVAIEEQFYAFWPLIFIFLPRKFILPAILTVVTGSLLFRFCNMGDECVLHYHTLAVMIDLATGALFAYLIISSKKVRAFFQKTHTITILASFILFFISMMYAKEIFSSKAGQFISRPYFAALFGFIIASQSMIVKPSALELGKIGFARKLGKYTYGMYLLHPVALEIIYVICKLLHIPNDSFFPLFISAICGLALTIVISWLSYEYFEKKFLNLKKLFGTISGE